MHWLRVCGKSEHHNNHQLYPLLDHELFKQFDHLRLHEYNHRHDSGADHHHRSRRGMHCLHVGGNSEHHNNHQLYPLLDHDLFKQLHHLRLPEYNHSHDSGADHHHDHDGGPHHQHDDDSGPDDDHDHLDH